MKLSPAESKLECLSQDLPKFITQSWSLSIRMQITRAPLWSLATVRSQSITLRLLEDMFLESQFSYLQRTLVSYSLSLEIEISYVASVFIFPVFRTSRQNFQFAFNPLLNC